MRAFIAAALLTLALLFAARYDPDASKRLLIDSGVGSGGADQSFEAKVGDHSAPADEQSWIPAAETFSPASQIWPPDEFKRHNLALVLFVGRDGIAKFCGAPPPGIVRLGCQYVTEKGLPIIAIANPCLFPKTDFFAGIACHELAHVNGWSHP